ncbi:hypothetical protein O6H91_08G101400 [Diphasiastrum complanatum]|uniref:Uncharacterized protein n=1 Tax=Diphasiastrum complanatum TaxID=34168 RepID=A0ACC2D0M0_DIPCM|nr:hypothetical protein O6H91_08G101400 [Diphasiastrum complanatum]
MDSLRVEEAGSIAVGVDFGTTFSRFAFALRAEPEKIYTFCEWPMQQAPYLGSAEIHTNLRYVITSQFGWFYELADWDWPALLNYIKSSQCTVSSVAGRQLTHTVHNHSHDIRSDNRSPGSSIYSRQGIIDQADAGLLVSRFKLHLADTSSRLEELPRGLSVERAISDYLSALCQFIMTVLKARFGNHVGKKDVQWCITVPVIWDENAKERMKACAESAGMVGGQYCRIADISPHPLIIALEPEAASLYCQRKCQTVELVKGDKFLVADIGSGTVGIVVHELLSIKRPFSLREVSRNNGGLCGGNCVDESFFNFLSSRIRCFEEFVRDNPYMKLVIAKQWNFYKYRFSGSGRSIKLNLPERLAAAWEKHSISTRYASEIKNYYQITLTDNDLIFPVVSQILLLIESSIIPDLTVLFVVGGFASSPYLMRKIHEEFGSRIGKILSPPDPSSAVCCGAVMLGLSDGIILSRVSRKTYGILSCSSNLRSNDPFRYWFKAKDGTVYCANRFMIFVSINTEVPINHCISHSFNPAEADQEMTTVELYSSSRSHPIYTTESGAKKEASFKITFPSMLSLGKPPEIEVSMYFGRSTIEVSARVTNSGNDEKASILPVKFERHFS